jgi:hypothetical protein
VRDRPRHVQRALQAVEAVSDLPIRVADTLPLNAGMPLVLEPLCLDLERITMLPGGPVLTPGSDGLPDRVPIKDSAGRGPALTPRPPSRLGTLETPLGSIAQTLLKR